MPEISNSDDVIDSRAVLERIGELRDLWNDELNGGPVFGNDERAELCALRALAEQGETVEDWSYGVQLIRETYFSDYARELADDLGAVPADYSWPTSCVDWDQAARELQMDYTPVEFAGVTYWVR